MADDIAKVTPLPDIAVPSVYVNQIRIDWEDGTGIIKMSFTDQGRPCFISVAMAAATFKGLLDSGKQVVDRFDAIQESRTATKQ